MLRELPKGASILDFGCGNGLLVKWLLSKGRDARGVDFHLSGLANIEQSRLENCNLNDTGAIRAYFQAQTNKPEAVILRHVLEHLVDPSSVLEAFKELGVKQVWVWVPNGSSFWKKFWGQYWPHWDPPRHLHVFNPTSIKILAATLKAKAISISFEGIDELVISVYRLLRLSLCKPFRDSRFVQLLNAKSILSIASHIFFYPLSRGVLVAKVQLK